MLENEIANKLRGVILTLVPLGKPGCGKKTIFGEKLVECFDKLGMRQTVVVESGELFRNWIKSAPFLFKERVMKIQTAGILQPDALAARMWIPYLEQVVTTDEENIIFDGLPRTKEQLPQFLDYLKKILEREPIFIHIDISDETAMARMRGRDQAALQKGEEVRMDSGSEEVYKRRLSEYWKLTHPMIESIPEKMRIRIDGEPEIEKVFEGVLEILARTVLPF
jgi:adenylate kinase family enzyme